jgi:hypothetical protein
MLRTRYAALLAAFCCALVAQTRGRCEEPAKPAPKLIIIKAVYGDLPDGGKEDVTAKVKDMVKDNALTVAATNDNFGDPAEGIGKKLKVEYKYGEDGKVASAECAEHETLTVTYFMYQLATDPKWKLTILKAVYGDLPDGGKVDVTEQLKKLVQNNSLTVAATNDNFTDPAEGIGKKLRVEYKFGEGKPEVKECAENETLVIKPPVEDPNAKLKIKKAVYGDLPDGNKTDVTEKVRAMVKGDTLSVAATNDNFGDPAEGVGKKLKVDYTFGGVEKSKTVDENETLTINDKGE